jgi:hypothetical protein
VFHDTSFHHHILYLIPAFSLYTQSSERTSAWSLRSFFFESLSMKMKRIAMLLCIALLLTMVFSTTAFAAGTGDVAGAIEGTWTTASQQIKTVVNKVVFPGIDLILAVFFFAKLGTAYFDYRKHGQFEWVAPAILFACRAI